MRLGGKEGAGFTSGSGEALKYRASNYAIERVAKGAGLLGVGLTAVQQLLGHSMQAMTERYAHFDGGGEGGCGGGAGSVAPLRNLFRGFYADNCGEIC